MSIAEKLTTIAENQQRVFDAGRNSGGGGGDYDSGFRDGYDSGYWEGYDEGYVSGSSESYDSGYTDGYSNGYDNGYSDGHGMGFSEGENAEYNRFWDSFQQNGNRTDYTYGFAGAWDRTTFLPKYDIKATSLNVAFHGLNRDDPNWETFDLVEHLENLGVVLDTSKSTLLTSTFMWARICRIGVIDCRASTYPLSSTFAYGKIKTIDKLIVKPELTYSGTYASQTDLVNITIEGTIGQNGLDMSPCTKLSRASIESVINHLSTTTSGLTVTFSKTAVTNAFGSTTASAWTTLVNSKSNWTISLV